MDYDVVIIGAGLSGIISAAHLKTELPEKKLGIFEMRETLGGTWSFFKYPGFRTDSDMHTMGSTLRPWRRKEVVATGDKVLTYLENLAKQYRIDKEIQFRKKVTTMEWSSEKNLWTVTVDNLATKETEIHTAKFICYTGGYYAYDKGHLPNFKGMSDYQGTFLHTNEWSEDIDYKGKKIIVIGSGATAVTVVPKLAEKASKVLMVQRSPTYIFPFFGNNTLGAFLRKFLPNRFVNILSKWGYIFFIYYPLYMGARIFPKFYSRQVVQLMRMFLPKGFDVKKHFTPSYHLWRQRLCLAKNGDFFKAIREGKVEMHTDVIERFTKKGLKLASLEELEADIIIATTGINMQVLKDVALIVDGETIDFSKKMMYKGVAIEDIPNCIAILGYVNISWGLKADVASKYFIRLMRYMEKNGYKKFVPVERTKTVERLPLFDFESNYIQRVESTLVKQGNKRPWNYSLIYPFDWYRLKFGRIHDGVAEFYKD